MVSKTRLVIERVRKTHRYLLRIIDEELGEFRSDAHRLDKIKRLVGDPRLMMATMGPDGLKDALYPTWKALKTMASCLMRDHGKVQSITSPKRPGVSALWHYGSDAINPRYLEEIGYFEITEVGSCVPDQRRANGLVGGS